MARLARLLALAAALALPAAASAAPIPGAHYSGTTDQNYPINFDVSADGTYLTNVVTTVNGSCGLQYSTNSTFAFPIAGDEISGDDPDAVPYLRMRGTFTSPEQASGTLSAFNGTGGSPLFCNALERRWRASTDASAPGPGPVDPGPGPPSTPSITISAPSGVLLQPSLKSGFIVPVTVDQAATLSAKLILGKKDAKKYGLGKKAVTVSKASAAGGADSALEFKFKKAVAKKLKKAKKLKFVLEVTATAADGTKSTATETLTLGS
ncbi:MAG: hypothetical protein M3340_06105 [Actinomycetota bacterium]|nr:hypothetical protein [Actinomycetota bacterium]